jgi:hypothetical protein
MLVLYRPFLFEKPEVNSPDDSANEWRSSVEQRTKDSATSTNRILGNMIGADMINSAQAMMYLHLQIPIRHMKRKDAKYR